MTWKPPTSTPSWIPVVYIYRDAEGRVIYIGQTECIRKRRSEHAANSEWWTLVASEETIVIRDAKQRRAVEKDLLQSHQPPFNTYGTEREIGVRALIAEKAERHGRRHWNGWPCDCESCARNYDYHLEKGRLSPLQIAAGHPRTWKATA